MLWKANEKCMSSWMMSELRLCPIAGSITKPRARGWVQRPSMTLLHALTQKGPAYSEPPRVHSVVWQALVISGSIPGQEPSAESYLCHSATLQDPLLFPSSLLSPKSTFSYPTFSLVFLSTSLSCLSHVGQPSGEY